MVAFYKSNNGIVYVCILLVKLYGNTYTFDMETRYILYFNIESLWIPIALAIKFVCISIPGRPYPVIDTFYLLRVEGISD